MIEEDACEEGRYVSRRRTLLREDTCEGEGHLLVRRIRVRRTHERGRTPVRDARKDKSLGRQVGGQVLCLRCVRECEEGPLGGIGGGGHVLNLEPSTLRGRK